MNRNCDFAGGGGGKGSRKGSSASNSQPIITPFSQRHAQAGIRLALNLLENNQRRVIKQGEFLKRQKWARSSIGAEKSTPRILPSAPILFTRCGKSLPDPQQKAITLSPFFNVEASITLAFHCSKEWDIF
ncbi:MAG TPA: hypothetical protein PKI62_04885 [bacterium]|nr:hypothetical protein [bacterium]HPR87530.1 hypothetical protein [bacterium]